MPVIGWVTFLAYCWLALFQLALAAGLPLGRLAWGGGHRVLPARLRLASAASIGIAVLGIVATGQALGHWGLLPKAFGTLALWALGALFALSLVGNVMTTSRAERLHGVPLTVVLSAGSIALALRA